MDGMGNGYEMGFDGTNGMRELQFDECLVYLPFLILEKYAESILKNVDQMVSIVSHFHPRRFPRWLKFFFRSVETTNSILFRHSKTVGPHKPRRDYPPVMHRLSFIFWAPRTYGPLGVPLGTLASILINRVTGRNNCWVQFEYTFQVWQNGGHWISYSGGIKQYKSNLCQFSGISLITMHSLGW